MNTFIQRLIGTPSWLNFVREGEGVGGGSEQQTAAAAAAAAAGSTAAAAAGGSQPGATGGDGGQGGSGANDALKTFEGLEKDNLDWLQKTNLLDPKALAKQAYNQEKLLGSAIRLPGKDAKPEEIDAFYTKLGRPAKADGYEFVPPKDMPEGMAYDEGRAKSLKEAAFQLGLTPKQAAAMHDLYVQDAITGFKGAGQRQQETNTQHAVAASEALVKRWGPLDGDTAKANFEIANRVFTQVPGGSDFLTELKSLGLVGPNKEILSEPIAVLLANIGGALFKEDDVLHGTRAALDNPFADGDKFNLTQAMAQVKKDPDHARMLIAAAGKKPSDFGLK